MSRRSGVKPMKRCSKMERGRDKKVSNGLVTERKLEIKIGI